MSALIPIPYRLGRWLVRAARGFHFTRIERFRRDQVTSRGMIISPACPPNSFVAVAAPDAWPTSIRLWGAVLPWLAASLLPASANLSTAKAETNATPARITVAVTRWLPVEPLLMAPEDCHWRRTFTGLVSSELRHLARLNVVPEDAVLREIARQKRVEPDNTNTVAGIRTLGRYLRAPWVIYGAFTRTGTTWTAYAYTVEAASGEFGKRLSAVSTNWFELRDELVRQVLQRLDIAPSPEERKLLGRVWTTSSQAFEWFSRASSDPGANGTQRVELCRKALAEDPQFVEARLLLATTLYSLGRDEEALREAKEALSQKPDRYTAAQLYRLIASVHVGLGREDEAQQAVAEGLRLCPGQVGLLMVQSALLESRHDFQAASDCLRQAAESDPRNPPIHALLGMLQSKQGDLTNAMASLELAEQFAADTNPDDQVNIELALAEAHQSVGNLAEALRHYRRLLAEARDAEIPESRLNWVRETVRELERRSQPVPVVAETPRQYSPAGLQAALRERLSPEEFALAVNPIASTPEMARWASEIVGATQGDLARARRLFEQLASRPHATGGASRTAQEVFAAWNDLTQTFLCQEYAKLFVALARSVDLPAFYVHVERDYCDRIVDHDCAVVFAEGKAWLADPAYVWFGVPHREFRVLDDLQTVAHHAFQPHGENHQVALCRAARKLDPEFIWGRMALVMALSGADQLDAARKELDAARKSAPEHWRGYQLEGLLAFRASQPDRAVEWLRRAANLNRDDGDTRLMLGAALFQTGQQAAAREEFLAGLRRPHGPENEQMAGETLVLIEEALGLGSNVLATSKSRLDAKSYLNLGVSFLSGSKPDYAQAAKWLRTAAEMGDSSAQGNLGFLYWTGRGVPRDPVVAVNWFRKAAEGGDPQAMRCLGVACDKGLGVKRNPREAIRWLRRAAEAGDAQAQAGVGRACYEGWNTPKNNAEALFWLTLATEAYASSPDGDFRQSDPVSSLRKIRYLLEEVELFAKPEEKAEAKAKVERYKAKRTSASGAPKMPPVPSSNAREDDVTPP